MLLIHSLNLRNRAVGSHGMNLVELISGWSRLGRHVCTIRADGAVGLVFEYRMLGCYCVKFDNELVYWLSESRTRARKRARSSNLAQAASKSVSQHNSLSRSAFHPLSLLRRRPYHSFLPQ